MQKDFLKNADDRKKLVHTHKKELDSIQKDIDKLIEMKLQGIIDDNEFTSTKLKYKGRENELRIIINNQESKSSTNISIVENFLKFGELAYEIFKEGAVDQKRIILSCLSSNLLLKDKKLEILLEKPILLIKDRLSVCEGGGLKMIGANLSKCL